jgi:hypothetical protein
MEMIVEIEVDLERMRRIKEDMKNEGNLNKKIIFVFSICMYDNNMIKSII